MNRFTQLVFVLGVAGLPLGGFAQSGEFTLVQQNLDNPDNEPRPVFPVPSARQLKWNQTEFYGFFHYGMNTYTAREWGLGSEDENLFAPTQKPNPRQWLETVKKAGMRGGIAVVKHHDGFCLWPTKTTDHNVTKSSNAYAQQTNIPKDFAEAAKELGMKYGFYISPWDRNNAHWGAKDADGNYTSTYTNEVFFRQCAEMSEYGEDQFEMWFDGATGADGYYGGANETRTIPNAYTYYDIPNLRDSIHNACPDIILWGQGGEARWIGNEDGWAGETCWSYGDGEYGDENAWRWNAGESDAKATNGWFWASGESVKSAETLFKMYLETVGRNATFILNFPPDKTGELPAADVKVCEELGNLLRTRLGNDLAKTAKITASNERTKGTNRNYVAANMTDGDSTTYWATDDAEKTAEIVLQWDEEQEVRYVTLMEYITLGQRVKAFTIETSTDGTNWTKRGGNIKTTTIGYKRIIPLNGSTSSSYPATGFKAKYLRVKITDSKACPTLHTLSVY